MQVIFVNYHDFFSPSGMHIFHLANALVRLGVRCTVYSPNNAASAARYGKVLFRSLDRRLSPRRLLAEINARPGETLIHSWTPRECSRILTAELTAELPMPVVVHMEDHEEANTLAHLQRVKPEDRDSPAIWLPGGPLFAISHPERHKEFLRAAAGYTCIIESLLDFKPEQVPGHVFWPSCEPEVFALPPKSDPAAKVHFGMNPEDTVIFYPGNVHPNNYEEVLTLYMAASSLRESGEPVRVIKFGLYPRQVMGMILALPLMADILLDFTEAITPEAVPQVMRAADFLVQPGADTPFNRYRFPCKLPLFLASGRPVILPRTNLGKHLVNGEHCLLLQSPKPDAGEIAAHLRFLIQTPEAAASIGEKGRAFAREHFSWATAAKGLRDFYASILEKHRTS